MGVWKGIYLGLTEIEAQKEKEADREARRQEKLAELVEQRRNILLGVAAKRKSAEGDTNKYAGDLAWLESRAGSSEKADRLLSAAQLNPAKVSSLRDKIEKAEVARAKEGLPKTFQGDEFVGAVTILGNNLDNEEMVENFTSTGDYFGAVLTGNVEDRDEFERLYLEGQTTATPNVDFDISPSIYATPNIERFKYQQGLFDQFVLDAAKSDLAKAKDPVEFGTLSKAIENYNKEDSTELKTRYGTAAFENMMANRGKLPALQGIEQNPYFLPFFPKEESAVPVQPAMTQAPTGGNKMPLPEAIQLLMSNPSKYAAYFQAVYPEVDINNILNTPRAD